MLSKWGVIATVHPKTSRQPIEIGLPMSLII